MAFWGDRNPGDRIDWDISFVNTSGVPTAISSGSAFCRRLSTLTIAPAGVLFTASGGLNRVTVFTGSSSSFYVAGDDYSVVMAAGTISSNSTQDLTVGQFSLHNRSALRPTTATRTLDVSAAGEAGLDWANIGNPTTGVNLSGTNIDVDQIIASVSGAVGSVVGAVGSVTGAVGSVTGSVGSVVATTSADVVQWRNVAPNVLIAGRVDANAAAITVSSAVLTMATGSIASTTFAASAINAAALATDAVNEIADGMFARSLGTEAYAADTVVPTFAEMQFMLWSVFSQFSIATTTITTQKLDGTAAMTFGMDAGASTATSRTRLT